MAWNEPGGDGKDPWGQGNKDQGPPDLDELVNKLQQRMGGLFGGNKNGDGGSGDSMSSRNMAFIGIIILVVWGLFGFYTVQPAERGAEMLFGAYQNTTKQGLNWYFPYPVGKVKKVNVDEVRSLNHQALMLTQDENIVRIELEVQYNIDSGDEGAHSYLFNVRAPDSTLRQATESALREVVGTTSMDEVLTSGRTEAAERTKKLIQEMLDRYATGLVVRSVNMQNAQPPEEVQAAFADVIKAREDEERHKNTAQAYANGVVQKAGGSADRMRQEANAYREQVIAHAEGETKRFSSVLAEYKKAPEVTRQRLYLETMEGVLANTSKVMIDVKGGNNIMYLPLDKLMNRPPELVISPESYKPLQSSNSGSNDRLGRDERSPRGGR